MRTRRGTWWPGVVLAAIAVGLIGFPLIVAALGVLLGIVAAALAVAVAVGPWVAVAYLGYRLVTRSSARRRAHAQAVAAGQPWQAAPGQPMPAPPPAEPARDPLERLPEEQRAQVDRIRRKGVALLQRAEQFPTGSRNLHLVQRTLDTYLPATLNSYLAMPPGADEWVVAPDGRTGLQVLRDQLSLLEAKLDEVNNDLWQADVQRLLANERFLEEHFGRKPDELTIR
jgi:hypothetical protein